MKNPATVAKPRANAQRMMRVRSSARCSQMVIRPPSRAASRCSSVIATAASAERARRAVDGDGSVGGGRPGGRWGVGGLVEANQGLVVDELGGDLHVLVDPVGETAGARPEAQVGEVGQLEPLAVRHL